MAIRWRRRSVLSTFSSVALLVVAVPPLAGSAPTVQAAGATCNGLAATIVGTPGDDVLAGGPGADVIVAHAGDDTIDGGAGDDTICAGDGKDLIDGGPGNDWIDGGKGDDTLTYAAAPAAVNVDLGSGAASGGGGADTFSKIPRLIGSEFGDKLAGNAGDNRIEGLGGNDKIKGKKGDDVLLGQDGDDVIQGRAGDDDIRGGPGTDTASFFVAKNPVTVNLAAGTAAGDGNDVLAGIEDVRGSQLDDFIVGDAGDNVLFGFKGHDHLSALGGDDTVRGKPGDDVMLGGPGDDVLLGGGGSDEADGGLGSDTCKAEVETFCLPETISNGKLAFVRHTGSAGEIVDIYTMNPDGSGVTRRTSHPARDTDPAWSPDGRRIAFVSDRTGTSQIFVMDADGANRVRVTSGGDYHYDPAWSPDGTSIAYGRSSSTSEDTGIWVMDPDGGGATQLTANENGDFMPSWSPDGSKIAFMRQLRTGPNHIWPQIVVIDADGGGLVQLTDNTSGELGHPAWSPDGAKIAYSYSPSGLDEPEVWTMNPNGSGKRTIADGAEPAWSPDGRNLAFSSQRDPIEFEDGIFAMNADGTGATRLTMHTPAPTSAYADTSPAWQPVSTAGATGSVIGSVATAGSPGGYPLENICADAWIYKPGGFSELVDQAETDANGLFALEVPPGTYIINFWDCADWHYETEFFDGVGDSLAARRVEVGADATFYSSGSLRVGAIMGGFVTSEASGQPIEDILAAAEDAGQFLVSGFFTLSDGYYELHLLRRNDSYRIIFFDFDGVYALEYWDNRPNFDSADWILMHSSIVGPINAALAASSTSTPKPLPPKRWASRTR